MNTILKMIVMNSSKEKRDQRVNNLHNTDLRVEVTIVVVVVVAEVATTATGMIVALSTRTKIATIKIASTVMIDLTKTMTDLIEMTIEEIIEKINLTIIINRRRSRLTGAKALKVLNSMTSQTKGNRSLDNHACKSLTLLTIAKKVMMTKEATLSLIDKASKAAEDVAEDVVVEAVAVEDEVIVTTAIPHSNNTKKSITDASKEEPTPLVPT